MAQSCPCVFPIYIFPHNFFTDLLPHLAEVTPHYDLQCEIKANQTAERVKAFADAGFSELQPGIESFDSNVLRLMDKGVTGIQNVHLLRQGYLQRHTDQLQHLIRRARRTPRLVRTHGAPTAAPVPSDSACQ